MRPIITLICTLAVATTAVADCVFTDDQKLTEPSPQPFTHFGCSVAISGDRAIIGADMDDDPCGGDSCDYGGAFIYERSGGSWQHVTKLVPSPAEYGAHFGTDVDIDGNFAIVGAPDLFQEGRAFIFRWNGSSWVQDAMLVGADTLQNDHFGNGVAIAYPYAAVTAWQHDEGATNSGAVYVFERVGGTWVQRAELVPNDVTAHAEIYEVDMTTTELVYGAVARNAVYVCERSGTSWSQVQKLTAAGTGWLGASVTIDGTRIMAGSPFEGESTGGVVVFRKSGGTWIEEQHLTSAAVSHGAQLGMRADMHGDVIVAGAYNHFQDGYRGAAAVFRRSGTTWNEEALLVTGAMSYPGELGLAVAVENDHVLVGAHRDADTSGAVFRYDLDYDTDGDGTPDPCECPADLDDDGAIGFADLVSILSNWGPCAGCPADLDGDGEVGFSDLLAVTSTWGPCS